MAATRDELLAALRGLSVPVGAVNDMPDVFRQDEARRLVVHRERGGGRGALGLRQVAFDLDGVGRREEGDFVPPPRYAEHTVEVLTQTLGWSLEEVEEAVADGAVEEVAGAEAPP